MEAANVRVRDATSSDAELLTALTLEAFNWSPEHPRLTLDELRTSPELAKYVASWPAPGELGVVAVADDEPVGAAWLRYFPADAPGYGFVAEDVPELSIATVAEWRGRGVGSVLLSALAGRARAAGIGRISLSVQRDNVRARRLYASAGYEVVGEDDDALTMVCTLE